MLFCALGKLLLGEGKRFAEHIPAQRRKHTHTIIGGEVFDREAIAIYLTIKAMLVASLKRPFHSDGGRSRT